MIMDKNIVKTKVNRRQRSVGLLPSMLIICISALIICVSLTIIVFSLLGMPVYGGIKTNEMLPQLRGVTAAASSYMCGDGNVSDLFLLTRASDATLVILDEDGQEYFYHDPKLRESGPGEMTGREEPPALPNGGIGNDITPPNGLPREEVFEDPAKNAQHNSYIVYCKSVFDSVTETADGEYKKYEPKLGAVVAKPIVEDDETIGAAYLIMPVTDISEASGTVLLVLAISAAAVALFMVLPIYTVTRWLTNPIKKMKDTALSIAEGDYSCRVDVEGSTEVCELGESLNTLAENLQENIGKLVIERNRLRAILDGLGEGIIGTDSEGRVIQHNNSALVLLGGKVDESRIESLEDYGKIRAVLDSALQSGGSSVESFACGERTLRVSASAIPEENGATAGAVAMLMDITEAERLEQTRRDYVANVSHELRTPLASIRGIADMLNDGMVKKEEDKTRYYGYILKESMRLSVLINDLLELSRLQSGGVALEMRRVELYELLADVADRMTEPAAANDMTIKLDVKEGVYYAKSNADRLEQVMISLVDNAVKHGTHGGRIAIGLNRSGDKWNIYVENPAEVERNEIEHLFERFYKADTAHTGEGTGLGLAITEEVLHLMGERIWIDYEGGVIRFTFTVQAYAD